MGEKQKGNGNDVESKVDNLDAQLKGVLDEMAGIKKDLENRQPDPSKSKLEYEQAKLDFDAALSKLDDLLGDLTSGLLKSAYTGSDDDPGDDPGDDNEYELYEDKTFFQKMGDVLFKDLD